MYISAVIIGEGVTLEYEIRKVSTFLHTTLMEEQFDSLEIDFFVLTKDHKLPEMVYAEEKTNFYYTILPENEEENSVLQFLKECHEQKEYEYILFGSTIYARCLATRFAAKQAKKLITNIKDIVTSENMRKWCKDIFLGNAVEEILIEKDSVVTLANNIAGSYSNLCRPRWIENTNMIQASTHLTTYKKQYKENIVGWENADNIIVIGNGVDKAGLGIIEMFAKQMRAEIAGTRRAVENGLLPIDRMIGISGKSISPKLCIIIGASGLAAFVKGIEKSKTIICINPDKEALIFKYADYGIVAKYQDVIK